ncbi:MAG: hypothetical protein JNL83_25445 [Myxococcales bacterium]|nr:hypothetical protein [Myxococcales bacterium]
MIEQGGELSASARALLDAARDGLTPDAAAVRRVRDKVAAGTAAGAGVALALKLGVLSVIAAVAIGGAVHASRDGGGDGHAAPAIALPSSGSESAPVEVQSGGVADPAPPARAPVPVPAIAMPRSEARADLAREVALIDRAMVALKAGDAREALMHVRTHGKETRGSGQLAEDAAAIEIEALCRLHDAAVSAKLDAFDARFPRSAQRSRLTTECP